MYFATVSKYHNYKCYDSKDEYTRYKEDKGITNYFPDFHYPDYILSFIKDLLEQCDNYQDQGESCDDCESALNRHPILKTGFIKYQIMRLGR